jgi:hypothetical protein
MEKSNRLELLSFCESVKPQVLVDLLVAVSKKHPDLPLFNAPDWAASVGSRPSANSSIGSSTFTFKPKPKKAKTANGTSAYPDEDDPYALPPTWPKPGKGLYATLLPEDEADDMAEENEAFEHWVYQPDGTKSRVWKA